MKNETNNTAKTCPHCGENTKTLNGLPIMHTAWDSHTGASRLCREDLPRRPR